MELVERVPPRAAGRVRLMLALGVVGLLLCPRLAAAGSITGSSWDGAPPGTLADVFGESSFSFGLAAFAPGVYEVTWLGGITRWRGLTTIGAGDETLFDPGYVAAGTARTIAMVDAWTMWATTPALLHAESTGVQWAFAMLGDSKWAWGLEDIAIGRCDCDFQDAYGTLARVGDTPPPMSVISAAEALATPTPTPDPPTIVGDAAVTAVPEPGTMALVSIGLAGVGARLRRRQR